jgi:hypothetical protein
VEAQATSGKQVRNEMQVVSQQPAAGASKSSQRYTRLCHLEGYGDIADVMKSSASNVGRYSLRMLA